MHQILRSKWTYFGIRFTGFALLAGYLAVTDDWRFSFTWALAVPAIAFGVASALLVSKISDRLPSLNGYLLFPRSNENTNTVLSRDESDLRWVQFAEKQVPVRGIPFAAAEDGLVCVPVLLAGIGPISALAGGIVFGLLHLARFSYFECLGKTVYYSLTIYLVLPHGLLTVAAGHIVMDALGLAVLRVAKRRLIARMHSNHTVNTDVRESGARGSP